VPAFARTAALALIGLLMAMFPANIQAARAGHLIGGRPHTPMCFVCRPTPVDWATLFPLMSGKT
jgi:uncharacterized membrane protein